VSATQIFSSSWYRVRQIRPRLRSNAKIHRHLYRGETWHVLQELTTERFFRFTPSVYSVVGMMNGRRTVEDLWQEACSSLGDDAPTQDEMIQLLSQLYQADVLQCDVPPDAAELLKRHDTQTRRKWQSNILSVFSWRFPLLDPERFLQFMLPVVRPLFSWFGALIWLAILIPALVIFGTHWTDLTRGILDRVFLADNILLLWLVFPVIKACHEFGHAFTARVFGGEVHEMGVMLLFGMVCRQLGFVIEAVQAGFPDCEAKIEIEPGRWQHFRIEFEYESRNFLRHMHDVNGCDLIVCWKHNWLDCPLEVVELRKVVGLIG